MWPPDLQTSKVFTIPLSTRFFSSSFALHFILEGKPPPLPLLAPGQEKKEVLYMPDYTLTPKKKESGGAVWGGGGTCPAPDGQCVMLLAIVSQFSHTASSSHYMI